MGGCLTTLWPAHAHAHTPKGLEPGEGRGERVVLQPQHMRNGAPRRTAGHPGRVSLPKPSSPNAARSLLRPWGGRRVSLPLSLPCKPCAQELVGWFRGCPPRKTLFLRFHGASWLVVWGGGFPVLGAGHLGQGTPPTSYLPCCSRCLPNGASGNVPVSGCPLGGPPQLRCTC